MRPSLTIPLLALLAAAGSARAEDSFRIGLPIACTPGKDCWVVRNVDHDQGPGFKDYQCGGLGGDAHDGVDFAIPDMRAMAAGVPVVAAADGVVRGTRDGLEDLNIDIKGPASVADRECGNGVAVTHADGYDTQYCHMRRGSVQVRTGDTVKAGQQLGLVGISGLASFPHVHMTLRKDSEQIDPFTGGTMSEDCGATGEPLWQPALLEGLAYTPAIISGVGIAGAPPSHQDLIDGAYDDPGVSADADALVVWMRGFGLLKGDQVTLRLTASDGTVIVDNVTTQAKTQAFVTSYAGKKRKEASWPAGPYLAEVEIRRGDAVVRSARPVQIVQ